MKRVRRQPHCRQRWASALHDRGNVVIAAPDAATRLQRGAASLYLRDRDLLWQESGCLLARLLAALGGAAAPAAVAVAQVAAELHERLADFSYRDDVVRDLARTVTAALNTRLRRTLLFVDVLDLPECDLLTLLVIHNLLDESRTFSFAFVFKLLPPAALATARRPLRDRLAYQLYLILELTVRTKQWARANDLFDQLLRQRRRLTQPRLLGLLHFRAGMVYVRQGQLPRALLAYQQSRRLLERVDDRENLVKVHNNIGNIFIDLGRYRAALTEFSRSLAIAEEFQNDYSLAVTYSSMGTALLQLGDAAAAVDCQKKSLLFAARSGYFSRIQVIYNCLASAYSALGRRTDAERLFTAAWDFAVAENELYDQYAIMLAMARHHLVTGDALRCREALDIALRLAREFNNRFGQMQVQELYGDLASTLHRWKTATSAYRRALALARELKQPRFARALTGKLARAGRQ